MTEHIVITGIGLFTPCGTQPDDFWELLLHNKTVLAPLRKFSPAPFPATSPVGIIPFAAPAGQDRAIFLLQAACRTALQHASLSPHQSRGYKLGLSLGTSLGGISTVLDYWHGQANTPISQGTYQGVADSVATALGCSGPTLTFNLACASGGQAIAAAQYALQHGRADIMLAAGVDVLNPFVFHGFACLHAMAPRVVRPFDKNREGLGLGEGAGVLVLETATNARKRGASILAQLASVALSMDAVHISAPDRQGRGLARAIELCLQQAQLATEAEIAYINAHGTATRYNDMMEAKAIKLALPQIVNQVPVSSIKGAIGHTLGAAGVLEAIVALLALRHMQAPPTCGLVHPDPECRLAHIIGTPQRLQGQAVLSLNAAFGGQNVAVLLRKPS